MTTDTEFITAADAALAAIGEALDRGARDVRRRRRLDA